MPARAAMPARLTARPPSVPASSRAAAGMSSRRCCFCSGRRARRKVSVASPAGSSFAVSLVVTSSVYPRPGYRTIGLLLTQRRCIIETSRSRPGLASERGSHAHVPGLLSDRKLARPRPPDRRGRPGGRAPARRHRPAAAEAAVAAGVAAFGRIDVVVNNAGYANLAAIEDITAEDFREQLDANLLGVVNVTKAALPVLRAQGGGHILQVSSIGGRLATPGLAA